MFGSNLQSIPADYELKAEHLLLFLLFFNGHDDWVESLLIYVQSIFREAEREVEGLTSSHLSLLTCPFVAQEYVRERGRLDLTIQKSRGMNIIAILLPQFISEICQISRISSINRDDILNSSAGTTGH